MVSRGLHFHPISPLTPPPSPFYSPRSCSFFPLLAFPFIAISLPLSLSSLFPYFCLLFSSSLNFEFPLFLHPHSNTPTPYPTETMRVTKSVLLTALFLAVVQAQQAEQRANQAAFEAHQQPTATQQDQQSKTNTEPKQQQQQQQHDQQQPLGAPPQELTPEEFEMAKEGIRQILGQLPIQHVEPLVNTMEGYCSTFGALCTAACKERMTDDYEEEEEQGSTKTLRLGCADLQALTIGTAGASCQCASYDMTNRINFAM